MNIAAIIVAAGRGTRAGGGMPKQYRNLCGKPVLYHSIMAMLADRRVAWAIVVIHPDDVKEYAAVAEMIADDRLLEPALGCDTRKGSVCAGLLAVDAETVLIHDGARPCLPPDALARVVDVLQTSEAAFLAMPVTDALWKADSSKGLEPKAREDYWLAQTPQGFDRKALLQAHNTASAPADDDVALARQAGIDVQIVTGSKTNIKITSPTDFALAKSFMKNTTMGNNMEYRTGNGFDVHRFGPGNQVILCGVSIPFSKALKGHSDADVGMHAITDAIFGALAEADIGQWFPPDDPQWKGAASQIFLKKAAQRVKERGFVISNVDCTLICEAPKIGPYAIQMRQTLADIMGIATDRVSVKATTTEQLGFAGRGEGIAAQATASLVMK